MNLEAEIHIPRVRLLTCFVVSLIQWTTSPGS